jgi:hypothetical protein
MANPYSKYTGSKISAVPAGYLAAAAKSAEGVRKSGEKFGDMIGAGIAKYYKSKKDKAEADSYKDLFGRLYGGQDATGESAEGAEVQPGKDYVLTPKSLAPEGEWEDSGKVQNQWDWKSTANKTERGQQILGELNHLSDKESTLPPGVDSLRFFERISPDDPNHPSRIEQSELPAWVKKNPTLRDAQGGFWKPKQGALKEGEFTSSMNFEPLVRVLEPGSTPPEAAPAAAPSATPAPSGIGKYIGEQQGGGPIAGWIADNPGLSSEQLLKGLGLYQQHTQNQQAMQLNELRLAAGARDESAAGLKLSQDAAFAQSMEDAHEAQRPLRPGEQGPMLSADDLARYYPPSRGAGMSPAGHERYTGLQGDIREMKREANQPPSRVGTMTDIEGRPGWKNHWVSENSVIAIDMNTGEVDSNATPEQVNAINANWQATGVHKVVVRDPNKLGKWLLVSRSETGEDPDQALMRVIEGGKAPDPMPPFKLTDITPKSRWITQGKFRFRQEQQPDGTWKADGTSKPVTP